VEFLHKTIAEGHHNYLIFRVGSMDLSCRNLVVDESFVAVGPLAAISMQDAVRLICKG
jgi:hypothetical protein